MKRKTGTSSLCMASAQSPRTPGWWKNRVDLSRFDDLINGWADLTVSIMEQVFAVFEETQGHVLAICFIFMRMSHAGQADVATLQMNEQQDIDRSSPCPY